MANLFPNDCTRDCEYYHTWDISLDDWTNVCDILRKQVDDCDMDFIHYPCPLNREVGSDNG